MESEKLANYQSNYAELPFENILRGYRQQNIFHIFSKNRHQHILELGCGPHPLFKDFNDFEKMLVVEPGEHFYEDAVALAANDKRIQFVNNFFENIVDEWTSVHFDIIVIGGFLHEIANPSEVLQAVKKLCKADTIVHSFVPNAQSFHRLLAFEMGLITDIYEKSGHDHLFERHCVYNIGTFKDLFQQNGFQVVDCGTYFVKPFTHSQLIQMLGNKVINESILDGLNKMSKYMPEIGAEIFINATIQ